MNNYLILFATILLFQVAIGLTAKNPRQCFDVLNKLPQNEIEKIYFMTFQNVSQTHPAFDILSCFLRASHPGDKSVIEQYFDVYKKCEEYKRKKFDPFGNQQIEELIALGLPYDLERYLRESLKRNNKKQLEQAVQHVQNVLSKDIEISKDYKDYKMFIAKKYKPNALKVEQRFGPPSPEKSLTSTKVDSQQQFLEFLTKVVFAV